MLAHKEFGTKTGQVKFSFSLESNAPSFPLRVTELFYCETDDLQWPNGQWPKWPSEVEPKVYVLPSRMEVAGLDNNEGQSLVQSDILILYGFGQTDTLVHQTKSGLTWAAQPFHSSRRWWWVSAQAVCFNARQKQLWRDSPPDSSGTSGLCTCCSLWLACTSSCYPRGLLCQYPLVFTSMSSFQWHLLWPPYFKVHHPSPAQPSLIFLCGT